MNPIKTIQGFVSTLAHVYIMILNVKFDKPHIVLDITSICDLCGKFELYSFNLKVILRSLKMLTGSL